MTDSPHFCLTTSDCQQAVHGDLSYMFLHLSALHHFSPGCLVTGLKWSLCRECSSVNSQGPEFRIRSKLWRQSSGWLAWVGESPSTAHLKGGVCMSGGCFSRHETCWAVQNANQPFAFCTLSASGTLPQRAASMIINALLLIPLWKIRSNPSICS